MAAERLCHSHDLGFVVREGRERVKGSGTGLWMVQSDYFLLLIKSMYQFLCAFV